MRAKRALGISSTGFKDYDTHNEQTQDLFDFGESEIEGLLIIWSNQSKCS